MEAVGSPSLAAWFWSEYKNRQAVSLARALKDQEQVSKANFNAAHRPSDGLGQCTFRIAKSLRDWIARRFGWDAATDPQFCKELIRDNQNICFVPTQEQRCMLVKTRELTPNIVPAPRGDTVIVAKPQAPTVILPKHGTA